MTDWKSKIIWQFIQAVVTVLQIWTIFFSLESAIFCSRYTPNLAILAFFTDIFPNHMKIQEELEDKNVTKLKKTLYLMIHSSYSIRFNIWVANFKDNGEGLCMIVASDTGMESLYRKLRFPCNFSWTMLLLVTIYSWASKSRSKDLKL